MITTCAFNEYCGHGAILRRYMDVAGFVPITGRIQHGWSPRRGGMPDDALSQAGPLYFWSRRAADEWRTDRPGYAGQATVIGAPFLYAGLRVAEQGNGLLFFPFHGTVARPLADAGWTDAVWAIGNAARYAGMTAVTVCLYDLAYREGPARAAIEAAGFSVTTAGSPWDGLVFMDRLVSLIGAHDVVAASRPCTAIFYALALGRPCTIVPDGLRFTDPDEWEAMSANAAWGRAKFPRLYARAVDPVWRDELGADALLPPDRLFETLYGDREVAAC